MKLRELASIHSGLVLSRKQAKEDARMHYRALTLRCIRPNGMIDVDQLDVYDATEVLAAEYLTHEGDIVIRLTAPYTAVFIDESTSGIVISSSFVVIRADEQMLWPDYLYWLLNTEDTKRKIYDNATGSMINAIKPRYFADMEIHLLPLIDQKRIADLNTLAQKEMQLLFELAEMKKKYYDKSIEEIYQKKKRGTR